MIARLTHEGEHAFCFGTTRQLFAETKLPCAYRCSSTPSSGARTPRCCPRRGPMHARPHTRPHYTRVCMAPYMYGHCCTHIPGPILLIVRVWRLVCSVSEWRKPVPLPIVRHVCTVPPYPPLCVPPYPPWPPSPSRFAKAAMPRRCPARHWCGPARTKARRTGARPVCPP